MSEISLSSQEFLCFLIISVLAAQTHGQDGRMADYAKYKPDDYRQQGVALQTSRKPSEQGVALQTSRKPSEQGVALQTSRKPSEKLSGGRNPAQASLEDEMTVSGSVYEGLRQDYLLTITLPWTVGMISVLLLLLYCMRTDGWLYRVFTEDYVPPAVKKRMEEEARRTAGKRARLERQDNWGDIHRTWEKELIERSARVKSTMPPNDVKTDMTSHHFDRK